MQKVVGSSPIIRSPQKPRYGGDFVVSLILSVLGFGDSGSWQQIGNVRPDEQRQLGPGGDTSSA